MKSMCDDMAAQLARIVPRTKVILGGHDWGGFLVWRLAAWYPEIIKAVFSVCTPYVPPSPVYFDLEMVVARVPSYGYQLQLAGPAVEAQIAGREKLRQFLNGMYGGRGPNSEAAFDATKGVLFENLDKLGQSPMLSPEELEYYTNEYARNGMRGPLNWYRTRKINYGEELALLKEGRTRITVPSMMIVALRDSALTPSISEGMERYFDKLVKRAVDADHWALWEAPDAVNGHIREFLATVAKGDGLKSSL
jgi:pimeloyl-ACP methyl ester carboxylesterase